MPSPAPVLLLPREHGTYGELLFPLVAALGLGAAGVASAGAALAATGGYLAHEAFVVLIGRRGARARRDLAVAAWRSLAVFGGLAVAGAALAAPRLTESAWLGAALAAALSVLAVAVAWLDHERTLGGEVLAAVALPSWSIPVALAGGVDWPRALGAWAVWSLGFAAATCAVQVVIARTKRVAAPAALTGGVALAVAGPLATAAGAAAGVWPDGATTAVLPASAAALAVMALPIHARRLRDVGWAIMAVSLVTLLLIWWRLA